MDTGLDQKPSVSIIIATYNRAAVIRDTLQAMMRVVTNGVDAEWIVVNNNSTDETSGTLESFRNKLPLRILNEPKQGKNAALNRALREAPLRDIVVFADDDASPQQNWIQEIVAACRRWPKTEVFGGKIVLRWPNKAPCPDWLQGSWLLSLGFAEHDLGGAERPYPSEVYPFGSNYWCRKSIFEQGLLFREEIGPIGSSRIMGSETSFLVPLGKRGKQMIYCPEAIVEHRLTAGDAKDGVLFRRAYSLGRGGAHIQGVYHADLLSRWPAVWHSRQVIKVSIGFGKLISGFLKRAKRVRMENVCRAFLYLGQTLETSRIVLAQVRAEKESHSKPLALGRHKV